MKSNKKQTGQGPKTREHAVDFPRDDLSLSCSPGKGWEGLLRHPWTVSAALTAAFWPVWGWYAARIRDGSDEPWCVLALVTALVFVFSGGGEPKRKVDSLRLPAALTVLYIGAALWLPPIFGFAVALITVGSALLYCRRGRFFQPGVWGLLLLSAPLIASLQFYLGYPLRALIGRLAAPFLGLTGFSVAAEGTLLNWSGQLVEIDAPCSGVRMLWAAYYLTFALAAAYRLNVARTALAAAGTLAAVIAANVWRAAALFYVEAGVLPMPDWTHAGLGVVAFSMLAAFVLRFAGRLREGIA